MRNNGTRDAIDLLKAAAERHGIPTGHGQELLSRVGRRGRADDGGQTGRLVLLDDSRRPVLTSDGQEITVSWCNTGEAIPNFIRLD